MGCGLTLLELLTSGQIDGFNARRGARVTLDFFAADLSGLALAGADLSGANLEKADLSGADLSGAVLAKANLSGADLTGATLDRCVAIRARLREAYLGGAKAAEAEFSGADFSEADLTGLHAPRGRFAGARFKDAVLANAVLTGADFNEARFPNADLRGADFTEANLASAELLRANATGARFVKASLAAARLAGAVLKSCHLAGADLTGADLSGVDLTGADLTGANLDRADLFDVQADPETLRAAKLPAGFADTATSSADTGGTTDLHFEDPSVAVVGDTVAVFWENADAEDTFTLRAAISSPARPFHRASHALAIPVDQVLSRGVVPSATGFTCVVFVDRPAGVELQAMAFNQTTGFEAPRAVRLGYTPVVKPVLVPDEDGFLIYGIGRQGALSVHRFDGTALTELMRAPAGTYRGFCGRLDPILLGKGGTVAAVRRDGIGKLMSAPTGYPGRLTAAAYRAEGELIALAWAGRGEKGLRFQVLGADTECTRLDAQAEVGALDLRAVGDRWLLVYTREAADEDELTLPMGVWLPGGKPFPLLGALDRVDVEDIRLVAGATPRVAMITLGEDLLVAQVGADDARLVARFGEATLAP
jgi:uncharacterized protein YjbI with pentapeptide repeats